MEREDTLRSELERLAAEAEDEGGDECCCGHDHEHHHHDHEHHHEHDHDHEHEHEHEHHHEHGESCSCGHDHEHHHHHHHGHDADEVFTSWGMETARKYTEEEIASALAQLDSLACGQVVRAKGYVDAADGAGWIYFDYVPGEREIRRGAASVTGRLCVIGANLDEDGLKELFQLG